MNEGYLTGKKEYRMFNNYLFKSKALAPAILKNCCFILKSVQ